MPFKVRYDIYDTQHTAPVFTSSDGKLAQVEYNDRIRKGGLYRMTTTVTPDELTKSEEYIYLVYQIRKLQKQYFKSRVHDVMVESLKKESELDQWNRRTQVFINNHPGYKPADAEAHAFYQLVFQWRIHWKDYFAYKKQAGADPAVIRERSKQCRDFEKQIDEYIKKYLQQFN